MICPHCQVSVPSGKWESVEIVSDDDYNYKINHFHCAECLKISIKFICNPKRVIRFPTSGVYDGGTSAGRGKYTGPSFSEEFLIPKTTPRKPIPKDVENIYVQDYNHAVNLLPVNSMASAAFSRRLLQHYIEKKLKIKKPDLKQEIKELKKLKRYPSDLIDLFDNVRHYGVFAAHAKTDQISGEIIDIDPGEADSLLDILEEMFDYDYERPRRIKDRDKKLQDKLKRSKSIRKKTKSK